MIAIKEKDEETEPQRARIIGISLLCPLCDKHLQQPKLEIMALTCLTERCKNYGEFFELPSIELIPTIV